jgi:hypothetical protein
MQGLLRPQRERVDLMTTTTSRERNGVPHVWLYDKKNLGAPVFKMCDLRVNSEKYRSTALSSVVSSWMITRVIPASDHGPSLSFVQVSAQ